MTRDFHFPGRSPAIAGEAMAATSHPLATLAAIETLRAGGNAADAAIAAVALLGVVEPAMTGIGGDCFCLVAKPDGRIHGYNGSGRAARAARAEALLAQGVRSIESNAIHAITVPGAVEAWAAILERHGRLGLDHVLQPAIRAAEEGFAVTPRVALDWGLAEKMLGADAGAARNFLVHGRAPIAGDIMRMPALAATMKAIAKDGPRAFYEGAIAEDIVATVRARGSLLTLDDFAAHRGDDAAPIASAYRGLDVVELPPNGQGLAALVLLNILDRFDFKGRDPLDPERLHVMLEAARLAYAVRDTHIADPAFMRTTPAALLDRGFAADLARLIDPARRVDLPRAPMPRGDTVYLTVVDRDRMAVSLINSLYSAFGVGIATEKTGIMLHNRGSCFVVDPAHPNCIGPAKRPMHTIIPALAMREGRCALSFGVMGGSYQAMGHAYVISNMVDHGMDVQQAIEAPRFFFEGEKTVIERALPQASIDGLKARGHDIAVRPLPYGGGQAIAIDWQRGVLTGASDHRKDGCALGY
jgi:gamma-glutamyltranspeptidase/glutathione hydrolase